MEKGTIISKEVTILICTAVLISTGGIIETVNGTTVGLGGAEHFLFLTPMYISEGGGGNSYIGDIGALFIEHWNRDLFVGDLVDDISILNAAAADALKFSHVLEDLPADDTVCCPGISSWYTVKRGLNILNIIKDPLDPDPWCGLPRTIFGEAEDTVVVNVLYCGEVGGGIQVSGGLLPEKLIVNYVNASEVYLGLGGRRSAGTYLIRSGNVMYGAGSGGIDGAVISSSDIVIDIGGGSNLFVHYPFDASAIPEPATFLLLGLGTVLLRKKRT